MKIENVKIYDMAESIVASGYPMRTNTDEESIEVVKQTIDNGTFGKTPATKAIYNRVVQLGNATGGHDQMLTGILAAFDLTLTNKAWIEAERYRYLCFVSSQSTVHRINRFNLKLQYNEYVDPAIIQIMQKKVQEYNDMLTTLKFLKENIHSPLEVVNLEDEIEQKYLELLYNNPAGFEITARITTNYRCLKNVYKQRYNHKLPEWREFCAYIKEYFPYFKEFCLLKSKSAQ